MIRKVDPNKISKIADITNEKDIPKAVIELAKKEGYKYCHLKNKKYQDCDVYAFHNGIMQYRGPKIALYKDGKATLATGNEPMNIVRYFNGHSLD